MTTAARSLLKHALILAALILAAFSVSSCSSKKDGTSADMEAINALHQRDMEAYKKLDVDTLATLWSDDIVTLTQGETPMIGKDANRAAMLRLREESSEVQITDYILSFNEVKIVGDWAFEWGTYSGTVRPLDGSEAIRTTGKVIRVLKKEADGSWKIARAMYDSDPEMG